MKSAINYVTVLLISCLLSFSSYQFSFAVEIAKEGERITILGDHKCFSWTLAGIKYVQQLGWTNAKSINDIEKCSMGAIVLKNGQSIWIDSGILHVSPLSGGKMLCHDLELKQNWRSKYVGYCTPYGQ
jgi:hypothetical protein